MTVTAQAEFRFSEGRLDAWWSTRVWWRHLRVRCHLGDGRGHDADRWLPIEGGRYAADCGPARVLVAPGHSGARLALCSRVEAPSETAVRELALVGDVALPGSTGPEWILLGGYQSWDPAGHAPVQVGPPDGRRRTHESWWTVGLADGTGVGVVGAADRAHVSGTRFTVTGSELAVSWCQPAREGHSEPLLPAGHLGVWDSDPVVLAATADVRRGLTELMRSEGAPRATPDGVPRGWLSWYHLGPWVQPEDILEHSLLLAGHPYRELGYDVVQLDDGWQEAYGDWVPNAKFRGGFRPLAEQLAARGQTLGVWTAPFLVSEVSELAADAPDDWFVFDPTTGRRAVDPRQVVFGPMHILDASNPAVRDHLRDTFRKLYEQGVRYFKADFLYAGGYPGIGALRAGMEAIREGIGDAYLLACGAPLLPVVGLADGCRIGPDTATPFYDFDAGGARPTIFADEVTAVARNVGALTHWAARFQIDPDVALVGGNLELEQGRQLVTIAALAGGPFFASDDLRQLPPERLALLTNPEVLALAGGPPAVPDWEPDDRNRPPGQWRRGDVVAVFNWSEVGVEAAVRAPGATGARDLWAGRDLPDFRDGSPLEVPAQGVRLLRLFRR
jgi:alpha-galactosidase